MPRLLSESCWRASNEGGTMKDMLFWKALAEIMLEDMASLEQIMMLAAEYDLSTTVEEMLC